MNVFLTYIAHEKTYLDLLNISIGKHVLLFFRLIFYNLLKSQRFFRSVFNIKNIKLLLKTFSDNKFCRILQVLKSPQVHKKSQETYAFKKYLRKQSFNISSFYLNKLYEDIFFKLLFFSFIIHLQKYFLDNTLKLKITKVYKLIL